MSAGKNKRKWWKGWQNPHRLVIRNEENLQELVSFRINLATVYVIMSSFIVLVMVLSWLLIAYTPLKRFMPGYDDIFTHPEYITLAEQVYDLEAAFKENEFYMESVRKLIAGETVDTSALQSGEPQIPVEILEVKQQATTVSGPLLISDTLKQINEPGFIVVKKNQETSRSATAQLYLIPPLKGVIIQKFDPLKRHYGIDLAAPKNTPVKSILDGYVISSDWTLETGNTVCIQHENNIVSFYKHNAVNLRKAGAYVKAGEAVAIIGNTGESSTGPHLHFELWINGTPVNPPEYIQF
jgi:murein DD-endopeptidase MepM/ murein hydrolase activator NlpD